MQCADDASNCLNFLGRGALVALVSDWHVEQPSSCERTATPNLLLI